LICYTLPGNGGELRSDSLHMQKPITILIADDNRHMRESLRIVLSPLENIKILAEASNGEEAMNYFIEHRPDIVLLDINMTPVNGFEAARKILKQDPEAKIIALSLHRSVSYCRNMFRIGAKGYVIKSSPYKELLEAIQIVASGNKFIDKNIGKLD
jgi:two-component system, NarL family, invasion response regulator UvrY